MHGHCERGACIGVPKGVCAMRGVRFGSKSKIYLRVATSRGVGRAKDSLYLDRTCSQTGAPFSWPTPILVTENCGPLRGGLDMGGDSHKPRNARSHKNHGSYCWASASASHQRLANARKNMIQESAVHRGGGGWTPAGVEKRGRAPWFEICWWEKTSGVVLQSPLVVFKTTVPSLNISPRIDTSFGILAVIFGKTFGFGSK